MIPILEYINKTHKSHYTKGFVPYGTSNIDDFISIFDHLDFNKLNNTSADNVMDEASRTGIPTYSKNTRNVYIIIPVKEYMVSLILFCDISDDIRYASVDNYPYKGRRFGMNYRRYGKNDLDKFIDELNKTLSEYYG